MRIAVIGAGAIGGYLGTRLALSGQEVTFVARRRNFEVINANGFRVQHDDGTAEHSCAVRAVQQMGDAGPQDVVILAVKAHQLRELVPDMQALFEPETVVVTMANGVPWWYFDRLAGPWEGRAIKSVDPDGAIAATIQPERIIGSVVYPAAELVAPGVVRLIDGNRFSLGEPNGERTARIELLSRTLTRAGFKAPIARDIRSELWIKLWGNLSFNPISALTRATLHEICQFGPTYDLAKAMMREGQQVAEALGVKFKISLDQRLAAANAVGEHRTSMLQDLDAGRALELDALVHAVIELGAVAGVATPTISAIHAVTALLARIAGCAPLQGRSKLELLCAAEGGGTTLASAQDAKIQYDRILSTQNKA